MSGDDVDGGDLCNSVGTASGVADGASCDAGDCIPWPMASVCDSTEGGMVAGSVDAVDAIGGHAEGAVVAAAREGGS